MWVFVLGVVLVSLLCLCVAVLGHVVDSGWHVYVKYAFSEMHILVPRAPFYTSPPFVPLPPFYHVTHLYHLYHPYLLEPRHPLVPTIHRS